MHNPALTNRKPYLATSKENQPTGLTSKRSISFIKYLRITIAFILLPGAGAHLYAQNNVSEIIARLRNATADSSLISAYHDIFGYYEYSNPDSAIFYIAEGLKLFTTKNNKAGIAAMTVLLGTEDGDQGRMEFARKRLNDALEIFEELKDKAGIASTHNSIGVLDGKTGHFSDATRHFMTALKIFEETGSKKGLTGTYLKLGVVNELNNNLDKALEFYNKASGLASDTPFIANTIFLLNNIGIVYGKKGNFNKSLEYFQKALAASDQPRFTGVRILTLTNLGIVYQNLGDIEKSLHYFDQALQITKDKNLPEEHTRIIVNRSAVVALNSPAKANEDLNEALITAKKIGQRSLLEEIYGNLVENHKILGQYKEAVAVMEELRAMEDSTFTIEKAREIANLESVYELEQSNNKIKVLKLDEQRNALKRNIIIAIATCLAIALLLTSLYYRRSNRLNKELKKRESELEKSNKVKDKLFSIIGHDLRGPVGNIPPMLKILGDETTTADEREFLISTLMDHSIASLETLDKLLYWGKSQIKNIGLKPETFAVDKYLQNNLKLVRNSADLKQITLTNSVPADTVINADAAHFDFIVRNLLSNAIKFTRNGGHVSIGVDLHKEAGYVVFAVKDDGVGIEKDKLSDIFEPFSSSTRGTANEEGTSMGLMLCKEFITENGGKIWVESEPGKGSTFYFSFRKA